MPLNLTARDAADVEQLLCTISAYSKEIARQRGRLRSTWQTTTEVVETIQAQIRALDEALSARESTLQDVLRNFQGQLDASRFQEQLDESRPYTEGIPAADAGHWLREVGNLGWAVNEDVNSQFDRHHGTARQRLIEAGSKTFGGGARRAGQQAIGRYAALLEQMYTVRALLDEELRAAKGARYETASNQRSIADRALVPTAAMARQALAQLPSALQPWGSKIWRDWSGSEAVPGVTQVFGGFLAPLDDPDLGGNAAFGSDERIPWFVSLYQNLQFVYGSANRGQALSLARSLLLRHLAAASPGELQFCFFDPVGLGQSVAELLELAEYDAGIIGGKVWSSPQDLAIRLAELTSHIELVIQKYLRSTYETIDDFNAAAGEIAEPYRLLVLVDFPHGLTDETMSRLRSIMQNGPRCGVHTLLLTNASVTAPFGVELGAIAGVVRRINLDANFADEHQGYSLRLRLLSDTDPTSEGFAAQTIIDAVGRTAVSRTESAVTFQKVFGLYGDVARRGIRTDLSPAAASTEAEDPSTWWRGNSTKGLFAPIGQNGARDVAILGFDSSDHSGALLVGRPGSGKSTLLHAYIGGLTTLYGPSELELYLIDFKEGVEFKSYAAEALPHARVVAIESDREFGLSVLQSLEAELSRRGELLRSTAGRHAGLQALREESGQALPRVLLVFDEFQVLFARNDKIGLAAADLLENIIRQGRGFGIHVLLGSQSLSGLDALGAHVPQLLPVRILLPATELDGRKVLGDNNDAGQYLTIHGEGILNRAGGAVEANERFRGALLTEHDRVIRLRDMRLKADREGFSRRPKVFEGNSSIPLDTIDPVLFREELAASGTAPVRLRAGSAMAVAGVADIELKREAGANVLVVMRDSGGDGGGVESRDSPAHGLLAAAVTSAALTPAKIDIIDFMPVDDGLDDVLYVLLDRKRVTLRRRRAFAPLIQELADEVRDRVEQDDAYRPARIAFLFGVHRARELDSEIGSLDADVELSEALERVLRDGPEVGVHTWLWADSVGGASRRLSSRMMRECSWRIAGKMSGDDSMSLIGTEQAADIRQRQLVLSNEDRSLITRAISFGTPSHDWLDAVLGPAATNSSQED
jgi:energy-coupling factor transporter ATP-binding protein EcfA2